MSLFTRLSKIVTFVTLVDLQKYGFSETKAVKTVSRTEKLMVLFRHQDALCQTT